MVPELVMVPALFSVYPNGIVNVMPEFIVSVSPDNISNVVMFTG